MLKFDCFVMTLYNTIRKFFKTGDLTPVIGHTYTRHEVHRNKLVIVSYCEHCDDVEITWQDEGDHDNDLMMRYGTVGEEVKNNVM